MGKVDLATWKKAKEMLKKKHVKTVAVLIGVSINTVYVIKRSKSYADYRRKIKTNKSYKHVMREYIKTPVTKPKVAKADKIRRQSKNQPWYKRLFA